MNGPILDLRGLHVEYVRRRGLGRPHQVLHAVNGVDLAVQPGESVGLVGESGSGKSTVARAVTGLAPVKSGEIMVAGQNTVTMGRRELRELRRRFQMVFQDPYSSLDPSMSIESSILEPLKVHRLASGVEARARVVEMIESVGLRASDLSKYPHEFSGGQRQRIAIARALVIQPDLLILDEAVSALDVSTRAQVLQLLTELRATRGLAYLFIGHDLAVVERMSDRIAVMYLGSIVEVGAATQVIERPAHPYTRSLLASIPQGLGKRPRSEESRALLRVEPADPWNLPPGCPFAPRCPAATDICRAVAPPRVDLGDGASALCHHVAPAVPVPAPSAADDRTGRDDLPDTGRTSWI